MCLNRLRLSGVNAETSFFNFIRANFLSPFVFLMIAMIELNRDKEKGLKVIMIAQLFYLIIGVLHISSVLYERAGASELGNALPLMSVCVVFVTGVLFVDRELKWGWRFFGAVFVFALTIIIVCATRKALGALIVIFIGIVLGKSKKIDIRSTFIVLLISVFLVIGGKWVMNNTLIGERIAESEEQFYYPLSSNPKINNFLMVLLGDRSYQYYTCLESYHKHPITGVGIYNYMTVQEERVRLHSEYLVQLYENGLVGIALLFLFYTMLFLGLNRKKKTGKNIMAYLFGVLSVLFINLTSWTYDRQYVMIIYAILFIEIYSKNTNDEISYTSPHGELQ